MGGERHRAAGDPRDQEATPDLLVITDVCLCEYTSTGHCGVDQGRQGRQRRHAGTAGADGLSHAQAGADIVAPSDMMDGRVGAIRQVLE